jgi:2-polyprenyl-3-methyl-5-hydroxy-6-metoxy-1,4-benzoquinol methylase
MMEHTPCPLCGANAARPVHELADWLYGTEGRYRLVRCGACGLLYLNPRPARDAMPRHYPSEYAPFQCPGARARPRWQGPWRGYGLAKRCRAVMRLVPRGRLLDVGCASGAFLAAMRGTGAWDVVGLERDEGAATWARERHGITVYNADVDEATFDEGAFDAITLWDVLEHLRSPGDTLRRLRPWLRDGGWLVLRVPDGGSPWARLFGRYWAGLDAPRHLVTFDRRTLRRLLATCGYNVKAEWTLSGTHAMAVLSVNAWLRATGRRRGWVRLLDSPIAQAFTAPPLWLTDRLLGGALVTVAAQPTTTGGSA